MNTEKCLKPAFSESKLCSERLSSEEFHRKLYEFFEDRGLLTDLRSHLRSKMINVLKETPIGKTDCKKSMSPKMQAINLLIAEFLIQQNCFYSLSVFSTEVPLANILPELNNNFTKRPEIGWKFEEKDAFDILQTLGFENDSEILKIYLNPENNQSLLNCILKVSPNNSKSITVLQKNELNFNDMIEILKNTTNLPLTIIQQTLEKYTQSIKNVLKKDQMLNKQTWENKNKVLELKEKQLQERERELQIKETELNEIKQQIELMQLKNTDECTQLKKRIDELREENARLVNLNGEQRRRAEKLKLNARFLSSELSAARTQRRSRVANNTNNSQVKTVSFSGEGEQGKILNRHIL